MHAPTLSAEEAAELLGVKRSTLYTYTSKGLIQTVPDPEQPRRRRYAREDVDRLLQRQRARSGHGPVAADALRWGEPVIESAITAIDGQVLRYRGWDVVALSGAATFEAVAELLWQDAPAPLDLRWPPTPSPPPAPPGLDEAGPIARMSAALPHLALGDPMRFSALPDAERARARRLLPTLAAIAANSPTGSSIAQTIAPSDGAASALDAALILCADHELNASTFAVRVAASTGADLYSVLQVGLATLSGPRHGGMCLQVERLFDEVRQSDGARTAVGRRLARGESLPGFGHPLYTEGDPRARALLALASGLGDDGVARDLQAVMADAGHPPPTLDFGLVALASAAGLPAGGALTLFAVGRLAGWIAHALEQREADFLLRPRARYTGHAPRNLPAPAAP